MALSNLGVGGKLTNDEPRLCQEHQCPVHCCLRQQAAQPCHGKVEARVLLGVCNELLVQPARGMLQPAGRMLQTALCCTVGPGWRGRVSGGRGRVCRGGQGRCRWLPSLCPSPQEYPLSALAGIACRCGFPTTLFTLHEREDEQLCAQKCAGEEFESCGTAEYLLVYQTQVQGELAPGSPCLLLGRGTGRDPFGVGAGTGFPTPSRGRRQKVSVSLQHLFGFH